MIKFGPSGNSQSFYAAGKKATALAPQWVADMGLNAYEYSFGRGIGVSDATATLIGEEAKRCGVDISAHAPYYINLANPDDEMAEKSYAYVLSSCRKVQCFGGNRVVFHPSTVGKATRAEALALTHKRIEILVDRIYQNGMDGYIFCPETMGKINQIGDFREIVDLCKIDKCLVPAVDFGHQNARTHGGLKTESDYEEIIAYIVDNLGFETASKMHIHFSKIEYGAGGEVRHLTFADNVYGPEFHPLAVVLKKYNLAPVVICESDGTQAEDAVEMKRIYDSL
jgi:deoxyribonuclease-4